MIGPPSIWHFATKSDYYKMLALYPDEARARFWALWKGRFAWFETGVLVDGDEGLTDGTHKVVEYKDEFGQEPGPAVRVQLEYRVDPNALFYMLGFTDDDVEPFMAGNMEVA
jgi:hypothetical protein